MAVHKDHAVTLTLTAASDMSAATMQFTLVKLADVNDNCVPCTAVDDLPVGVLQNRPAVGEAAEIVVVGLTKLRANADLTVAGGLLGTSTSGRASALTTASSGAYAIGRLVSTDTADNDGRLVTALVNCATPIPLGT
jgi:hypothetical protein